MLFNVILILQLQFLEKQISSLLSKSTKHQHQHDAALKNLRRQRDLLLKGVDSNIRSDETRAFEDTSYVIESENSDHFLQINGGQPGQSRTSLPFKNQNPEVWQPCVMESTWQPQHVGSPNLKEELVAVRVTRGGR